MAVPAPDAFADHLTTLSADAFASFVADLWRARGKEVRREGDVLIAGDGDETRRLLPVVRRRFRGIDPKPDDIEEVHVVVDRDGAAEAVTTDQGVRYVGPDELRSMTLYGIDRDDAEDLFRAYFDRPVDDGEPASAPTRTTTRTDDGGDRKTGRFDLSSAALIERGSALVLVLLVVVAGTTAFGIDPLGPGNGLGSGDPVDYNATDADGSGNFSVGAGGESDISRAYPPGVSDGYVDGSKLAAAQDRFLSNRSYRVATYTHGEQVGDGGNVRAFVPTSSSRLHVENSTHYQSESMLRTNQSSETGERTSTRWFESYADGTYAYTRQVTENRTRYYRTRITPKNSLANVTGWRFVEYLGDSNATVIPIRQDGETRFRVVVTDPPKSIASGSLTVRDYRAVAVVNESGFVSQFDVHYRQVEKYPNGSVTVRYESGFTIDDVGRTTVSPPGWYESVRGALNDTSTSRAVNESEINGTEPGDDAGATKATIVPVTTSRGGTRGRTSHPGAVVNVTANEKARANASRS